MSFPGCCPGKAVAFPKGVLCQKSVVQTIVRVEINTFKYNEAARK